MKFQNEFWAIVFKDNPDIIFRTSDIDKGYLGRLAIYIDREMAEQHMEVLIEIFKLSLEVRKVLILELETSSY